MVEAVEKNRRSIRRHVFLKMGEFQKLFFHVRNE